MPIKAKTFRQRQGPPKDDRPPANARGYDSQWQRLRDHHIKNVEPLCRVCHYAGELVHHLQPIEEAPERRLDPTNLATLCNGCHAGVHAGLIDVPIAPWLLIALTNWQDHPEAIQ